MSRVSIKTLRPLASMLLSLALPLTSAALQDHPSSSDGNNRSDTVASTGVDRGNALLRDGHLDEALEAFESVLRLSPANQSAREGEIQAASVAALQAKRSGDADGALVYLSRATHWAPDDTSLLMKFSLQADSMHFYKDADRAITEALLLQPTQPDLIYTLARVQLDEQKLPQAEQTLRSYLKLRPDDSSAHFGMGHLLHLLQRDEEAEKELNLSLRLQPTQTESYYELGQIALERGSFSVAQSDFSHVLGLNPKHAGVLIGMGIIAYRQKDYHAAQNYLSQGIMADPVAPVAHSFYSLVLLKLGETQRSEQERAEADRLTREQTRTKAGYELSPDPQPH